MKTQTTASGGVGLGRGGRMSRQRKRDAVLRLLRGEDLEILSRALGVTAATLSGWQDTFLSAGESSLATRSTDGEALETERLKAKLGEMLLERELLDAKIAGLSGILCAGPVDHHARMNLSSNMMANWVFASPHSRGDIFHSVAV